MEEDSSTFSSSWWAVGVVGRGGLESGGGDGERAWILGPRGGQ